MQKWGQVYDDEVVDALDQFIHEQMGKLGGSNDRATIFAVISAYVLMTHQLVLVSPKVKCISDLDHWAYLMDRLEPGTNNAFLSNLALAWELVADGCNAPKVSFCEWARDVLDQLTELMANTLAAVQGLFQQAADYWVDDIENSMH